MRHDNPGFCPKVHCQFDRTIQSPLRGRKVGIHNADSQPFRYQRLSGIRQSSGDNSLAMKVSEAMDVDFGIVQ